MKRKVLFAAMALVLPLNTMAQAGSCADIALVLAVDSSGSIDDKEYMFQKKAISRAFRDETVISTLREAGLVAVSAVFWGDSAFPTQDSGWFALDHGDGAEKFARAIEDIPRVASGNTDIGNGLWSALDLLATSTACPRKSIIDISGDGRESRRTGRPSKNSLYAARQRAQQMGVRINALAISDDNGELARYYTKEIILGSGSFVMTVKNFSDYSAALRKKLIRELAYETMGGGFQVHSE